MKHNIQPLSWLFGLGLFLLKAWVVKCASVWFGASLGISAAIPFAVILALILVVDLVVNDLGTQTVTMMGSIMALGVIDPDSGEKNTDKEMGLIIMTQFIRLVQVLGAWLFLWIIKVLM